VRRRGLALLEVAASQESPRRDGRALHARNLIARLLDENVERGVTAK
jgi:hypothetical protein